MLRIRLSWVDPKLASAVGFNKNVRAQLVPVALPQGEVSRLYRANRRLTLLGRNPMEGGILNHEFHPLASASR